MPVTIKDVARKAGVSSATVSRVLAGKPHVRQVIVERVLKVVEEMHYRPSRVAQSLRAQKSRIIGLIISDIMNPFFTSLVRAVEDIASERGYAVFLFNSDENSAKEKLYIEIMLSEQVAGVLITPTQEKNNPCQQLILAGIPVVAFDRRFANTSVDTVTADNIEGAYQAIEHLIKQGHRKIAAFTADVTKTTGRERLEGYRKAHFAYDLPINEALIYTGIPNKEMGREFTRELLKSGKRPTAIFCGNNLLTEGAMSYLAESGYRIPEDFALISFDDMDWYPMAQPPISAIRQPVYELGKRGAELLFNRIMDPGSPTQEIVLKTELIVRESSQLIEKTR